MSPTRRPGHRRSPPVSTLEVLSDELHPEKRPLAFVLAGHNGSGKSTLWYERLADHLRIPLLNADRLTLSILPEANAHGRLPGWAQELRDRDEGWAMLSQASVRMFRGLVMDRKMSFAFETVFSHWVRDAGGEWRSKADDIREMQAAGYFVVLLFVGLADVSLSVSRVAYRRASGGHDVPRHKLVERFPRTQAAVGHASGIADLTLMFDNSRDESKAFSLVRVQRRDVLRFDIRDRPTGVDAGLQAVARRWLDRVAPKAA